MARKPALTIDSLKELGPDKLAQIVLSEAGQNAGFARLVGAALAGQVGPEAIAKLVDRRLAGLDRARGFVDWNKAATFRDDLQSTVDMISAELLARAPALALDRLLRFIATHEAVFARIDDSSGAIQNVYYDAIERTGEATAKLSEAEAELVPGKIMAALGNSTHGYLLDVGDAVAATLPQDTLARWEDDLVQIQTQNDLAEQDQSDFPSYASSQIRDLRQTIAIARGDLDTLIALEAQKQPHVQDTVGIAERLFAAGRATDALEWVRRPGRSGWDPSKGAGTSLRARLEARILTALGDKAAAQDLRWQAFEQTLDVDVLREHVAALADFAEFDVLDRAFAHALGQADRTKALEFLMAWPRRDLAARLIVNRATEWDGNQYYTLPPIAEALEDEFPLAATILYRALLDDILRKARSKAYPYAARYLKRLGQIATDIQSDLLRPNAIPDHAAYLAALERNHARKVGFWASVARV